MPSKSTTTDEALREMAGKIGELAGSNRAFQRATLDQLSRLHSELEGLGKELDRKHEENQKAINEAHKDNLELLTEHKKDDSANFKKIFSRMDYISGAVAMIVFLWAVFRFLLPYLTRIKLGE